MRLTGYVAAIALLAVAPLAAQSKGTFEIGGFGRYTDYTNAYLIRGPDAVSYTHLTLPPGGLG